MNKRGFTLIELLVVIVIIGVLAGLTVPALNKAITQARFGGSQSNLRQIGMALQLHAQDNGGKFPVARGSIPYKKDWESEPVENRSWQMQLIPFTGGDEKIFFSAYTASFNPDAKKWSYFLGSHAAGVEQQENGGGFDLANPEPLNLNRIKAASKHIIAGEDHRGIMDLEDSDKDDYGQNNPAFGYTGTARKVNVLYADGHVESHLRFDPKIMAVKYEGIDPDYSDYE